MGVGRVGGGRDPGGRVVVGVQRVGSGRCQGVRWW